MSDKLEIRGKTVKEAVSEALLQMGARRDEVEVTVLEEPKAGLFGFLGSRQAKVLVEKKSRRGGRRGNDYRSKDKDAIAHELGTGTGEGRRRGGRRGGRRDDQQEPKRDSRRDGKQDRSEARGEARNQARNQDEPKKQETRSRGRDENEQKSEEGGSRRRRGRRGGRSRRGRRSQDEQANPNSTQTQDPGQEMRGEERSDRDARDFREDRNDRNDRNDRDDRNDRNESGDRNRRSRRSRRSPREDEQPLAAAPVVEEPNGNVEPQETVEIDGNRIDQDQDEGGNRRSRSRRGSRGGRRRSRRDQDDEAAPQSGSDEERSARNDRNDRDDRDDQDDRYAGNDRNDRDQDSDANDIYDDGPEEMIAAGLKASQYAAAVRDVGEEQVDETIIALATGMLVRAGFPCRCEVKDGEYRQVRIVTGDDSAGMLIGRHGSTVDAVEHLVERMGGMAYGDRVKMNLDINNYRRRREESLAGRVDEAVARVRESERDYHMEPMNARERRLIHLEAAEHDGIRTYTLMRGAEKHVVIALDRGEDEAFDEGGEENLEAQNVTVETEVRMDVSVEDSPAQVDEDVDAESESDLDSDLESEPRD